MAGDNLKSTMLFKMTFHSRVCPLLRAFSIANSVRCEYRENKQKIIRLSLGRRTDETRVGEHVFELSSTLTVRSCLIHL